MTGNVASLSAPPKDNRAADRHSCEVRTTCQPPSAWCKDPWPAVIRDISTAGLSLTLNRRFERGSGLAIELPTEEGTTATVLARVVHVRGLSDGTWLLGCDFISELSEEEVQLVLNLDPVSHASLSAGGEPPPSTSPTVNGVLFQAKFKSGEILRWYVKRLGLSGNWPLPRGKIFSMRVGGVSEKEPPLELKVRDCRLFGSYWIVDSSLLAQPSSEVLRVLTTAPASR